MAPNKPTKAIRVDESEPLEKEASQKIKDQAAALQRIANLLNGKKP